MSHKERGPDPKGKTSYRIPALQLESQEYRDQPGQTALTPRMQLARQDIDRARPADIPALQRLAGNRAVNDLIQPKLTVGPVGDHYEQEADRVAEQVVSMSVPARPQASAGRGAAVQRQSSEDEEIQTKLVATITGQTAGTGVVQALFGWGKKRAVNPRVAQKRKLIRQIKSAFRGYTTGGYLLGKDKAKELSRVQGGVLTNEQETWIRDLANLDRHALEKLGFMDPADVAMQAGHLQSLDPEQRTQVLSQWSIVQQMQISSALQRRTGRAHRGASAEIGSGDIQMEIIAHKLVYKVGQGEAVPPELLGLLDNWGFEKSFRRTVQGKGLFAGLLMPRGGATGVVPVLAFKGTTLKFVADVAADLDPVAVGFTALQWNKAQIKDMVSEAGGKVDVTGHSLGGALAQHFTSAFPGSVRRCVTFQAPGISLTQAAMFEKIAKKDRPKVAHHFATGDIVDLAGRMHLGGKFYRHTPGNWLTQHLGPFAQHSSYLLTAPELKEQRDAVGLTEDVMTQLKIPKHTNTSPIERFESHPNWFKRLCAEGARTVGSPIALVPALISLFQKTKTSKLGPTTIRNDARAAAKPIFEAYLKKAQKAGFFRKAPGITAAGIEDTIKRIVALDQRFASRAGSRGINRAAKAVFGRQVRIRVVSGRLQVFERRRP